MATMLRCKGCGCEVKKKDVVIGIAKKLAETRTGRTCWTGKTCWTSVTYRNEQGRVGQVKEK